MLVELKRGIKYGWKIFVKNFGLGLINLFVITITLFLCTLFFFSQKLGEVLINNLKEKADISVYFKEEVKKEDIFKIKEELLKIEGVENVVFTSKDENYKKFEKKHQNDPVIISALETIGNPFFDSLSIYVKEPQNINSVLDLLNAKRDLIQEEDYSEKKSTIDKIFNISKNIQKGLLGTSFFFIIISFLIVFFTVHLTILNQKEEIAIQKLVGASNFNILFPFLFQEILWALFGVLLSILIFIFLLKILSPYSSFFLQNGQFFRIFKENFFKILGMNILIGLFLSTFSTYFATKRCIKI
jgi:cell division transport system permease protein